MPNGHECKRAYEELVRREREKLISTTDTPKQKLDFLIEMFKDTCPATTALLEWQRDMIEKYYKNVP